MDAIGAIEKALERGFAAKGAKVYVSAEKSDYKDFIRMFVISDYFRGMADKKRLDEIYSILEAFGAASLIEKISLCVAMTTKEYSEEFGEDVFIGLVGEAYREMKRRPKARRLVKSRSRA